MEVSLLDERVNNASGPRNATMTLRTPLAAREDRPPVREARAPKRFAVVVLHGLCFCEFLGTARFRTANNSSVQSHTLSTRGTTRRYTNDGCTVVSKTHCKIENNVRNR